MAYIWRFVTSILVWLSSDPAEIDREAPKCAAAVLCARASMIHEAAPAPSPTPTPEKCCGECKGTGYVTHGDGHKTACPCPSTCICKKKACVDGKCSTGTVAK